MPLPIWRPDHFVSEHEPAKTEDLPGCHGQEKDGTLSKYFWIGGIVYGLGTATAAALRTAELWGSTGMVSLIQSAMSDGLLWPITLARWLA
jgi:hypothetical protein